VKWDDDGKGEKERGERKEKRNRRKKRKINREKSTPVSFALNSEATSSSHLDTICGTGVSKRVESSDSPQEVEGRRQQRINQ